MVAIAGNWLVDIEVFVLLLILKWPSFRKEAVCKKKGYVFDGFPFFLHKINLKMVLNNGFQIYFHQVTSFFIDFFHLVVHQ